MAGWYLPVSTFRDDAVISRFGDSRDRGSRRHEGIDILAPRGTPVIAPLSGRVVFSGVRRLGGNVVVLRSGAGSVELVFTHLERRDVTEGQRVDAGERLGTVGDSGNARGGPPHLHFEVHGDGGPVDPYPLLTGSLAGAGP